MFDLLQGKYQRLDKFQEDVFAILEKAREISRSDTEVMNNLTVLQAALVIEGTKCRELNTSTVPHHLVK